MAFPVPAHLPRKQDVSSKILGKLDQATHKNLNAALANSWLVELDETIQNTSEEIHRRIQADLPSFNQQLASASSVQTRLDTLSTNVDSLTEAINNSETGLVATLVRTLSAHAALAQKAAHDDMLFDAVAHLRRLYIQFQEISALVRQGNLSDAIASSKSLDEQLALAPSTLRNADILVDLKSNFNALVARAGEQLSNAYAECVTISPTEFRVVPFTQIHPSENVVQLPAIIASLSPPTLANHLNILRRDLTTGFVNAILKNGVALSQTDYKLSVIHGSPSSPLDNVSQTIQFLSDNFLSVLPSPQRTAFAHSLCKPLTTSVLHDLLIASLPSSFAGLPPFLDLVRQAVAFEGKYIINLLGNDAHDRPIDDWAQDVNSHYERKRRTQILDASRRLFAVLDDNANTFIVEVDAPTPQEVVVAEQSGFTPEPQDDGWGFDEEAEAEDGASTEEDGWGLDDDEPEPPSEQPLPETPLVTLEVPPEDSPDDAWGWNDDDDTANVEVEDNVWDDDPWSEGSSVSSPASQPTPSKPAPLPLISPSVSSPRAATRLEKLANKGKKNVNGNSPMHSPSVSSPLAPHSAVMPSPRHLQPVTPKSTPHTAATATSKFRPPNLQPRAVPKESYPVSGRMKEILTIVEDVLNEGVEMSSSRLISTSPSKSRPGSILMQSAASVLDLYRALTPVAFNAQMLSSPQLAIRFSNNCLFLSGELQPLVSKHTQVRERLEESRQRLLTLSENLLEDAVDKHCRETRTVIADGAQGFVYTGDQDRYDECESALMKVVQGVRRVAQQWKGIMVKSKYYTLIGTIVESALSDILSDVLALPDIPEVESHRLSELCRILHALEGLFVEDPEQPSFVVAYVPSWLKFSYLSELLEASIADITYLFETGALVDFEGEELKRLVQALFADTPLRTTLLNKLTSEHLSP